MELHIDEKEFDEEQLHQIRLGIVNHVDVELYAKKEFSAKKMCIIRIALEGGINPTKYVSDNFECADVITFTESLKKLSEEINNLKTKHEKKSEKKLAVNVCVLLPITIMLVVLKICEIPVSTTIINIITGAVYATDLCASLSTASVLRNFKKSRTFVIR